MAAKKSKGLGRGLSALIKDTPVEDKPTPAQKPVAAAAPEAPGTEGGVSRIATSRIHKSPWQPRRHFGQEALADLIKSVREHGILQPLLVRKIEDGYQLIAGERRFRAAQEAELSEVPVIVLDVGDREAVEITLIENLQREDLDPIEEAEGFQSLVDQFSMTQEQIAERVGKSRAAIANSLRLLTLSDSIKKMLAENRLSTGHAKVLLGVEIAAEQNLLAARVEKEGLSVRALEKLVEHLRKAPRKPRAFQSDIPASHLNHLTDQLHQRLGTSVRLSPSKTLANGKKAAGRIEIDYYSTDDLDRLLQILGIADSL